MVGAPWLTDGPKPTCVPCLDVEWPQGLADRRFDLLVIGGGINGAGIARDAAMRGLDVLLVDANDWGWATSSKSSMLAHGGLRYLEMFEFGLVHEALQDRERMLRQAPHLVRPLKFLYPIYPHVAARRTVRVGLWLYDMLSHGKSLPKRRYYKREETLRLAAGLNPDGLRGGATYYDGQIRSVERLIAELVWDAKAHGAICLNHTRVADLVVEANRTPEQDVVGTPHRRCTGAVLEASDGQRIRVHARTTINAAGTWIDDVLGPLAAGRPAKVRKTKGIHVVVPRFCEVALIVKAARDGRTFFILPWQEHCIIGTTDTDFRGDAGNAVARPDEVEYLLDEARRYFPDGPLTLTDVRYTYAGVRALVNQEGLTESNVTRRHIIYDHAKRDGVRDLLSLQGGKITTYRSLAEEAVDQVCLAHGRKGLAKLHPTRLGTLPGGPAVEWSAFRAAALAEGQALGLAEIAVAHLVDTYGARWRDVVAADDGPDGRDPVSRRLPHLWCEVAYAVLEEDARTVGDVMLRRTNMGLAADGNPRAANRVARRMAEYLGWDEAQVAAELDAYYRESRVFHIHERTPGPEDRSVAAAPPSEPMGVTRRARPGGLA